MRPSKFGKIKLDDQLENLALMNKEPFHLINSVRKTDFNFGKHNTWEAELIKRKTLQPIK